MGFAPWIQPTMNELSSMRRLALAEHLRSLRERVAEAVTNDFLHRHPDWLARYGERARRHGIEDACYHLDFLAGAVQAGTAQPFVDYARWTVRVLSRRGIEPRFVAENLDQVGQALAAYLPPDEQAHVAHLIGEACAAARENLPSAAAPGEDDAYGLTRRLFLQAILQGQRKAASTIVAEAVGSGQPIVDIYVAVLQESLYEVGRLWEENRITVAVEHMATAIVQFVMAQLYTQIPLASEKRGNAVITGVQGELHQVGANMVADVLEARGWNVRFLGTNMPHAGVLQAVAEHKADVVGISSTMLFHLPQVRQLVGEVREKFADRSPRVLIGGGAFHSLPSPAAEVGADGFAVDLKSALSLVDG